MPEKEKHSFSHTINKCQKLGFFLSNYLNTYKSNYTTWLRFVILFIYFKTIIIKNNDNNMNKVIILTIIRISIEENCQNEAIRSFETIANVTVYALN